MKKTGLGKGLNALFSDNTQEDEVVEIVEEVTGEETVEKTNITKENLVVQNLRLVEVEPNREQPRKKFDEDALKDLSESIRKHGVIQPIVVTKKDNYYQIIAGERRWRASRIAGVETIPAIVRENKERENKEIALIENIQREDLNAIEKAVAIKSLMDEYDLTQQEVADVIGKRRSTIANTVRLLNLDERVKNLVLDGKLTEGHCKAILSVSDHDKQYEAALRIIEKGQTVRDVEQKNKIKRAKKNPQYNAILTDIEDSFQNFFGSKVKLAPGKNKGKIVIEYKNNEDLERIIELLKR